MTMKMITNRTEPIDTEEIVRDVEDCVKLGGTIDGERVRRILQDFAEKMERHGSKHECPNCGCRFAETILSAS